MTEKTENEIRDDWMDSLKELISGGYIMLFMFGSTVCFIAIAALCGLAWTHDHDKIVLFKEILLAEASFLSGAYTTMWNNQHFKSEKIAEVKNGKLPEGDTKVVKTDVSIVETKGELK